MGSYDGIHCPYCYGVLPGTPLRDRLAMAALSGLLADKGRTTALKEMLLAGGVADNAALVGQLEEAVAAAAYRYADAALRHTGRLPPRPAPPDPDGVELCPGHDEGRP
jgi:hypothetical protein